jgi:hypothetical protein
MTDYRQYTLTIEIGNRIFHWLKDNGFNLCICKKVDDMYNVVWHGGGFFPENHYEWTQEFAVFGSDQYKVKTPVEVSTEVQDIARGQTCVLDKDGAMHPATGEPNPRANLVVEVQYTGDNMHIGVSQSLSVDGKKSQLPTFLSRSASVLGVTVLDPSRLVSVLMFFDKTLKTGMIFEGDIPGAFQFEYHGQTSAVICYNDQEKWVVEGNAGGV